MMRSYVADLATRSFFRPPEPKQVADFIEGKSQLARSPYEDEDTKGC